MHRLVLAPALTLAVGCSAAVVEEGEVGPESADSSTHASVLVESTTNVAGARSTTGLAAPQVRTQVSARFMRIRGDMDRGTAERLVGDEHESHADLGCRWVEPASSAPAGRVEGRIELLDVGDVLVHAADDTAPDHPLLLAARAFPDVGEVVSGVVYTSRDDSAELPPGDYLIETTGSDAVAEFSLRVDPPAVPAGVRLVTYRSDVALDGVETPVIIAGEQLQLVWDEAGAEGDSIAVTFTTSDGTLACSMTDDGSALIGARYTAGLSGGETEIVVHRHRSRAVRLPDVDESVVDFDFAIAGEAVVE